MDGNAWTSNAQNPPDAVSWVDGNAGTSILEDIPQGPYDAGERHAVEAERCLGRLCSGTYAPKNASSLGVDTLSAASDGAEKHGVPWAQRGRIDVPPTLKERERKDALCSPL
jgi:hypothetical protein